MRADIQAPARGTRAFALSLWILLATILGHALMPVGSPMARAAGSAFSASTADVALGTSRREAVSKMGEALEPPARISGPAGALIAWAIAPGWTRDAPARPYLHSGAQPFDARGPPAASI